MLFLYGIRITFFINIPFVNCLLTVGWIVLISNAFNLLDNMDGLSSGISFIAAFIFFIIARRNGQFFVSSMLVCFVGVIMGFLRFNMHPARIFMGDCGSLFIGFLLAVLTILGTYYTADTPTAAPIIMPLLIMLVPLFDTFSVIFIRLKNKVSIFKADRNHFSHRLVRLGMSKKSAVLFIYLVTFCTGLGAMLLPYLDRAGCFIILLQACCIILIIILLEKAKK